MDARACTESDQMRKTTFESKEQLQIRMQLTQSVRRTHLCILHKTQEEHASNARNSDYMKENEQVLHYIMQIRIQLKRDQNPCMHSRINLQLQIKMISKAIAGKRLSGV